jgi:hypothetical protein
MRGYEGDPDRRARDGWFAICDGVWQRGQITRWNPRTHEGMVRAQDGREFPVAAGCLMKSGLVTLVPGMRAEIRILGGECDWIRAAWH